MAHRMLKPYSILLYFLSFITFFFIGLSFAGIVEAGKNQGLAAGAIVLGYSVISAVTGIIIAIFISYKTNRKSIYRLNIFLALCIVGFYAWFHVKYVKLQNEKERENQEIQQPETQTAPDIEPLGLLNDVDIQISDQPSLGLGMFSPNLSDTKVLYIYDLPNLEKPIMDHPPADSITFKQTTYGEIDIATAPPYLVPEHLKLDYGILYFKAISTMDEFVEIEVNKLNHQTAYVSKNSGGLLYWPEFLLRINSVEFLSPQSQKIHVKPLNNAGLVNQPYTFMKPVKIHQNWMYVLLLNNGFETVGNGWIKWKDNGKLLISYSLLS